MKKYFSVQFLNQYRRFSFILVFLIIVFFIIDYFPQLIEAQLLTFAPLPTWEVQNPVSTVFVMDSIPSTSGSLAAGNFTVPDELSG